MEEAKHLIDMIVKLVWPVGIITFVIYYRYEIKSILERLKGGSFSGVGIDLGDPAPKLQEVPTPDITKVDDNLIKKINDADFNAKRGLYFTFLFNNNHIEACIFALRCMHHFFEADLKESMLHWLNNADESFNKMGYSSKNYFLNVFKDESIRLLDKIIDNNKGELWTKAKKLKVKIRILSVDE